MKLPVWWPWQARVQTPVRVEPSIGRPTEIEEADVQLAYIQGLVQGELRGRLALARELESQFAPNTTQGFDVDAAQRTRLKQLQ